jgi:hypothetical protein
MLFLADVTKWQANSWKRVQGAHVEYLLNTNRLDSIIEKHGVATLYYFDNPFDYRDSGHFMTIDMSVAEVIAQMDTALAHHSITLDMFPNNDITKTPVSTEISVADFAFAVTDHHDATHSWVVYTESGWDIKAVLVDHVLAGILGQVI